MGRNKDYVYEVEEEEETQYDEEDEGGGRKRRRSSFIDDAAEEDEYEEEEQEEDEDDDDDEDYDGGGRKKRRKKQPRAPNYFDLEALVDSDDDVEVEGEVEDDFIVKEGEELQGEDGHRGMHHHRPLFPRDDDQEDVEDLEKRVWERYGPKYNTEEYEEEETTGVDRQALLPSVRDPKLWMVKCAVGREREAAVCLMQKALDKGSELQIRSVVALDHLKNYIYVEADKGVPEKFIVELVRLREIKCKFNRKVSAQDRSRNTISAKDVVKMLEGPFKGKQGPVEHIFRGILFVYDRHHLEHAGFICVKSQSSILVGGSRANVDRNAGSLGTRSTHLKSPNRGLQSPGRSPGGPPPPYGGRHNNRGGRGGHNSLVGTTVKIRQGPFKGYRERVKDVKGTSVRVELESQMKEVTIDQNHISDTMVVATPHRDVSRYGSGSETPMHPSRTPLHSYMTPMRDPGDTPIHDGMRTPMRDRAWNPYTPMSPARDNWEDANPASWGSSPQYQPTSPARSIYEAPTPALGWANNPSGSYEAGTLRDATNAYANAPSPALPSTPGGQPMTPGSAGQPMMPGGGGIDMMSPAVGGDSEGIWALPDILVNVHKPGEDLAIGVVREVLPDSSCKIGLGSSGNGEVVIAVPNEIEIVTPRKSDKIKIMGGAQRGSTGKLIGVDGSDGIVKVDDTLDVKILDMNILGKLAAHV